MIMGTRGRILFFLVCSLAAAAGASGQCLDWAENFTLDRDGVGGIVRALIGFDDGSGPALYAGGDFDEAGGVPVDNLARWNGSSWSSVGPGPGPGRVYDLAVFDDGSGPALYATGEFAGLDYIAEWTGTGWVTVGGGLDARATELAVFDGHLYVAGEFTHAGDVSAVGIARWDGAVWKAAGSGSPGLRRQHAMAFDADRGRVVLFGGATGHRAGDAVGSTCEWDGQDWRLVASDGPTARVDHALAWHSGRNRTMLVGGWAGQYASDAWEWDGTTWTQLDPPPFVGRRNHAIAYDAHRDRLVLFGGRGITSILGDTWEWDGATWTQVAVSGPAPAAREAHALAYDPIRQRIVLHGGWNDVQGTLGDTWEWDGVAWTQVGAAGPVRREHAMVFDSGSGDVLLIGGADDLGVATPPGYAWDGASWAPLPQSAPGRLWHAAAYDTIRSRIVLVGGVGSAIQGDTWEFDGAAWSAIAGPPNEDIFDLALHDDGTGLRLYAGGAFTGIGGHSADRIASWDGASWIPITDGPNNEVRALQSFDDGAGPRLFVGGNFSHTAGMTCGNLAVWDGVQWSSIGSPDVLVNTMTVHNDGSGPALYIGGGFSGIGGTPASRIARWDGTAISPLGTGGTGGLCMTNFDAGGGGGPHLFVGGSFGSVGGNTSACIAEWGFPCTPPQILTQPASRTARFRDDVVFTVVARGTDPLGYQWFKDGVPLQDDGHFFGVATPALTIHEWSLNDAGEYAVTVTNALDSVESELATLTIPHVPASGPVSVTPIVVPPETVDTAPHVTITDVLLPAIAPTGEVLVKASIFGAPSNAQTLVWWDAGQTSVPIWPEDPAPVGSPGVEFDRSDPFWPQDIGSNGRYVFSALLDGPGVSSPSNESIWIYDGSSPHLLAREGFPAPGFADRLFIHSSPTMVRVLETGEAIFWGRVDGDPADAGGLWRWQPDVGVTHLAGAGLPAPGGSEPVTQIDWRVKTAPPNKIAFTGLLDGRGTAWFGPIGAPQVIAQSGDPAPELPSGLTMHMMNIQLGAGGDVLIDARIRDAANAFAGNALYHWQQSGMDLIVAPGDAAVGAEPDRTFAWPQIMAADARGRFVFHSSINGVDCSTCSQEGLWHVDEDGQITAIHLDEWPMPQGVPDVFTSINLDGPAALNDHGQLIFAAGLQGSGVGGAALFGWTARHGVFPIALPGTQFEVVPGEFRTISLAHISSEYLGLSGPLNSRNLTNGGTIALRATFTNDTKAILSGQFAEFLGAYYPCVAVVDPPHDADAVVGHALDLRVVAGGEEPIQYQWRRNGIALADDVRITGAATDQLTISQVTLDDAAEYDVVVTNACDSETSAVAVVQVFCPTDLDRSGFVDVFDLLAFLDDWFLAAADYDQSGTTDVFDLLAFLNGWFGRC